MDIKERLLKGLDLRTKMGEVFPITFKYEKLEIFCYFCGCIGHDIHYCKKREQYSMDLRKYGGSPRDIKNNFSFMLRATVCFNGVVNSGPASVTISGSPKQLRSDLLQARKRGSPVRGLWAGTGLLSTPDKTTSVGKVVNGRNWGMEEREASESEVRTASKEQGVGESVTVEGSNGDGALGPGKGWARGPWKFFSGLDPSLGGCKSEDVSHMQLIEREDIDDEEDLFEAIDKPEKLVVRTLILNYQFHCFLSVFVSISFVFPFCQNFGYVTGSDVLLKRKSVVRITTGSQALDDLLGGGIETMCITEAFGEFRSGKTQLAHTLCVTTQLPVNMKGGNGKVAYIDTEGTFRPDRIVPIAERFGMDAGAVLDNIIYARAYTYEHQYNLLLGLAAKMSEEPFRILIVDSVIALFRVDFTGRGELAERQQKLAQMLSRLTKIAEEFNVAVYMTNQVIADPGGGMFISDPKKPAGGHVLAHAATVRLMFRKGKGEQRVCKVFDSPNLPESEAISSDLHYSS
ncbi:hypothetical protein IFM89_030811 [Coptis chinensis]|uniref:Uncharacterized protein n=1 Tax=Coptis chinensis TaxID=261450 RepID=A0A835HZ52_9MAGN|nr:hypothetical protein IFM89_030811 [Coptis chinensis]